MTCGPFCSTLPPALVFQTHPLLLRLRLRLLLRLLLLVLLLLVLLLLVLPDILIPSHERFLSIVLPSPQVIVDARSAKTFFASLSCCNVSSLGLLSSRGLTVLPGSSSSRSGSHFRSLKNGNIAAPEACSASKRCSGTAEIFGHLGRRETGCKSRLRPGISTTLLDATEGSCKQGRVCTDSYSKLTTGTNLYELIYALIRWGNIEYSPKGGLRKTLKSCLLTLSHVGRLEQEALLL